MTLKHFRSSRRRVVRNVLMASAMAAVAASPDIGPTSAHALHAQMKNGTSNVGAPRASDPTYNHRARRWRREVREKLSASPSLARPSAKASVDDAGSGIASIYSGRQTASGEMMDPDKMTAAHRTLPFGTEVTVVNRGNGRSAVVRINDRGPFVHGRVLDLSPAAGRALGVSGLAPVSLIVGGGRHDESNHKPEQSPPPELVAEESRFAAGPPGP
jgi:rare lipoprotein A